VFFLPLTGCVFKSGANYTTGNRVKRSCCMNCAFVLSSCLFSIFCIALLLKKGSGSGSSSWLLDVGVLKKEPLPCEMSFSLVEKYGV